MTLTKMTLKRAEWFYEKMKGVSSRAAVTGYLLGLVQDVKDCIAENMESGEDEELMADIEQVEMILTSHLATAISQVGIE